MFGILPIGPWEMALILVIVLIIFGAGKLPQVGKSVGKTIKEFKSSVKDENDEAEGNKTEENDSNSK